jgi:uncharacterized protein (TIRG00374 family)
MRSKRLHLIIGLVIITLSLFFAFRGVSIHELKDALMKADYFYLIPALAVVVGSFYLRALRWRFLVCTVKEVKTADLFSPLMIGFMANMLPARAGEFIRAYLLSRKERISFSASFATIFIERLFDLVMVLLLFVWVLLFMPDAFSSGDQAGSFQMVDKVRIFGITSLTFCLFIFIFSALLQYKNELALRIVGVFIRPLPDRWKEKILGMVHSFTDGLKIMKDWRGFMATILLSLLIWALFVFAYYPLYLAFGIETELPIMSSLVILCLTVAIFITVAPTPGFLGSYHLGCVAALHGIFGIQKAVALSYGIVAWIMAMGSTVLIGAFFAVKENISLGEVSAGKDTVE